MRRGIFNSQKEYLIKEYVKDGNKMIVKPLKLQAIISLVIEILGRKKKRHARNP